MKSPTCTFYILQLQKPFNNLVAQLITAESDEINKGLHAPNLLWRSTRRRVCDAPCRLLACLELCLAEDIDKDGKYVCVYHSLGGGKRNI